jgi:hypothetical protein
MMITIQNDIMKDLFSNPSSIQTGKPLNMDAMAFVSKFSICMSRFNWKHTIGLEAMREFSQWACFSYTQTLLDNLTHLFSIDKKHLTILL